MIRYPVYTLVEINLLKAHEQFVEEDVRNLVKIIKNEGNVREPIVVDIDTMVILNGHHRVEALKRLGAKYIPAYYVNYASDEVMVDKWPDAKDSVSKKEVIKRGMSGNLYPPKTSKHTFKYELKIIKTNLEILF
ncbi:MAG: ParB N-terminal domain-containing protein [Candidatus Thermoplasmatota archaeon]|jgi:uncharacterized protein (DUF1015 family)|nr:ParB N-terminal domain-containing protein [Candidatus Thermoplasmatota archaeon]MCL5962947.1 ParB N-terminal domain-containing protein [Candidatus Thermoplasmatota archaeon]